MIKIESVHIEEMRGIRKLDLHLARQTYAISGPNGSGKSGVIDAIEFGLTGQIGRLTGRGTKGLSVLEHGPHVDKTTSPDAAFVTLKIFLTAIGKSATITRKVAAPTRPKIDPLDDDIKDALAQIAEHPEITLSRREILRFILVEPTQRSEEIQTLLKLEEIGQTRNALNTAQNKLHAAYKKTTQDAEVAATALQIHLKIPTLKPEDLLEAVNARRKILGLAQFTSLGADTKLDTGLSNSVKSHELNKEAALRDLKALADKVNQLPDLTKDDVGAVIAGLDKLDADPRLLDALQRQAFIEKGLDLVHGADCPLCDTPWDNEQLLRDHLKAKLAASADARKLKDSLLSSATSIVGIVTQLIGVLAPVQRLAEQQSDTGFAQLTAQWRADLESLKAQLATVNGIAETKDRLVAGWMNTPRLFAAGLKAITEKLSAMPDQTATIDAQTFLTTAQLRLADYRETMRKNDAAEHSSKSAKDVYDTYCEILEDELNSLYDEVQRDFSSLYRHLNQEDESTFAAKFKPSRGSLGLEVSFYERGLFPPAAYHSEGHQDSMGVCLYLALMKRLLGDQFTFALLDDVVMSVDSGHRYRFCKLLKSHFPGTQFVITTHDRLWAEQMKSAGLITGKTSIAFHSWTIDGGPLVASNAEIWEEIGDALARGRVETAAAALRHHLEYVSRHLAHELAASPPFRADANYELGDLLPSVLKRMQDLCGKAVKAAQSWGKNAEKESAINRKAMLSTSNGAVSVEQWAINKAVHYNGWANFQKGDFEPVVAAFKELLGCFNCPECESWLYATPRGRPEVLRCDCNAICMNLKEKPK